MQSHMAINNNDHVVLIRKWQGYAEANRCGKSQLSCLNSYRGIADGEHLKIVEIVDLDL